MTVDVYEFPPVGLTAAETTISREPTQIYGMSGVPRRQQSQPTRTLVTAVAHGLGPGNDGAGYIEALKQFLDGKLALVRVRPMPRYWVGNHFDLGFVREPKILNWDVGTAPGERWIEEGTVIGTAGSDGWPYLDCTGFPPSRKVATPGEVVTVDGASSVVTAPATSDASGAARIWLKSAVPSGDLTLGEPKRVFHIPDFPRATQPASGGYEYTFQMVEAFESDFEGGFNFVEPRWNA